MVNDWDYPPPKWEAFTMVQQPAQERLALGGVPLHDGEQLYVTAGPAELLHVIGAPTGVAGEPTPAVRFGVLVTYRSRVSRTPLGGVAVRHELHTRDGIVLVWHPSLAGRRP